MGASLLSPTHLIVIAVVGLLLFGAKRLPRGRALARHRTAGVQDDRERPTTASPGRPRTSRPAPRSHDPAVTE